MPESRAAIVAEAHAWLGTPYWAEAWQRGVACDCGGLVIGVGLATGALPYAADGPELAPWWGWSRLSPRGIFRAMDVLCRRLRPASAARAGDVVLFRTIGDLPKHLAILVSESSMVHADGPVGARRVIESRLTPEWRPRLAGAWAYPLAKD